MGRSQNENVDEPPFLPLSDNESKVPGMDHEFRLCASNARADKSNLPAGVECRTIPRNDARSLQRVRHNSTEGESFASSIFAKSTSRRMLGKIRIISAAGDATGISKGTTCGVDSLTKREIVASISPV